MSYSESFPTQRPIFTLDAANAGRLDSRISYSRSTTGTYFGTDKHLSSENLFLQSSDFDTTWYNQGLSAKTGGQTDPSGGTDGFTLVEDGAAAFHRLSQSPTATGELALTVYAKRNSGTRYLNLTFGSSGGGSLGGALATFDLAGGATHTDNGSNSTLTNLSATQTSSGNGYYKCVFKATASASITTAQISLSNTATPAANNYGLVYYTGDGTSSIDLAFASLTSTGATDYQATTTQIHREYAPTLQTAAINAPRFEHSASDSASMGLLVESQFEQHMLRSEELDNASWTVSNGTVRANAGVAPDGTLSADLLVEAAETSPTTNTHNVRQQPLASVSASTSYTSTIFAKAAGRSHAMIYTNIGGANTYGIFSLSDGSVTTTSGGGSFSSTSCGNGWYRLQMTFTTSNTNNGPVYFYTCEDGSTFTYTGNGYGSVLLWGANLTQSSHAYSYLKAEGSATTKAADSASVTMAAIGQNQIGNAVSAVAEFDTNANDAQYRRVMVLKSGDTGLRIDPQVYSGTGYVWVANTSGGTTELTSKSGAGTGFHKVAIGLDGTTANASFDGATAATMSNADTASVQFDKLQIGSYSASQLHLDGHIRNVSLYNVGLSAANVSALTK